MIKVYYRSHDVRQVGVGRNKRWSFDCDDCGTEVNFDRIGAVVDCIGCGETYLLDRNRPALKDAAYAYLLKKARIAASFRGFSIEDREDWKSLVEEHGAGAARQWVDFWFNKKDLRGSKLAYATLNSLRKHGTFTQFETGKPADGRAYDPADYLDL